MSGQPTHVSVAGMMTPKPKKTWKADQKQASLRSVFKTTNVKNLNLKGRKKHG